MDMKLKCLSLFFFCVLLSSANAQQCYDSNLLFLDESGSCTPGVYADSYPGSLPTNCSVQTASISDGCLYVSFHICCDMEQQKYQDSLIDVTMVTVPVDSEEAAADAAYDAWKSQASSYKSCASGYFQSGTFSAMKYSFYPSETVPGSSAVFLGLRSRTLCNKSSGGFSNYSVQPLPTVGGGSGGGGTATDMGPTNTLITQSNTLLTDINTKLSAPSGGGTATDMTQTNSLLNDIKTNTAGGGSSTDMTATNNLLTGIDTGIKGTGGTNELLGDVKNSLSGPSTLPSAPASSVPAPYTSPHLTDHIPTSDDYVSEFNSFKTKMENTTLYGLIGKFFKPTIGGGSSVFSFNAGKFGNHSYDFSSWGGIMSLLRGLVIIAFGAVAMRILFKGGS